MKLNPLTWLVWAFAALAVALVERNPVSQVLLLVILVDTWLAVRGQTRWWRIGVPLAVVPVVFDLVSSRFGSHVIFQAPIPLVGGPYTLEAMLYGAITGLAILLTIAIFAVLQASVKTHDVIALLPRLFYRLGGLVALALALVPQAFETFHRLQEIRSLRDEEKGRRQAPGLVLPVLLTTLERSLQYAESLDARGFGSRTRTRFKPIGWGPIDLAVLAAAGIAVLGVVLVPPAAYDPYVDLLPGLPSVYSLGAVLCLALPAVVASVRPRIVTRPA